MVATCSAMDRCPSIATQAGRLGILSAAGYDVNNGCAGFCTALAAADQAIRAGDSQHALVVGAERMSDVTDWTDRSTCVLLADGAGAAVLSTTEGERGIWPVVWGSAPSAGQAVRIEGWQPRFRQEGQTVFRWATGTVPDLAREACHRAGIATHQLGAVVSHQANLRIIEAIANQLDIGHAVLATDVTESGNTSAASVPIALAKLVEHGELASGALALLMSFGGGLSWAGQVVRCP